MRKISYMYEKSGGTNRFHTCSECPNYVQPDRDYNYKTCALHPERPMDWKPDLTACRYYCGEKSEEEIKWQQANGIAEQFLDGKITVAEAVDLAGKLAHIAVEAKVDASAAVEAVTLKPWPSHQMTIDEWIEAEGI